MLPTLCFSFKSNTMYKTIPFWVIFLVISCDSGPKVIKAEPINASQSSANAQSNSGSALPHVHDGAAEAEHSFLAQEILNTERYTYVKGTEEQESFWVAIPKSDIKIGTTYYYRGGLLKKDFFSKEHNRTFETLYLVSGLSSAPVGASEHTHATAQANPASSGSLDMTPPNSVSRPSGSIPIGDLVKNMSKYDGKTVKVTGKVMKVNQMIMNRNWLHLQDGTGNNFDLTVTSSEALPPGHVVTLEGVVALNKDFGAGYRYDILIENASLVK
jgi:hypothetical protein